MTSVEASALDSPPWSALTGDNRALAQGGPLAVRYVPEVAPFGALAAHSDACFSALVPLVPEGGRVALQTFDRFDPPAPFAIDMQAPILQMVLERPVAAAASGFRHVELGAGDVADMLDLAGRTRPGPFGVRTIEFGRYIGVRSGGRLVAMAGLRMRFGRFVEISAVCVDPAARGHGYAADLIATLAADLQAGGHIPFLHVFDSNAAAIALYRKLGFATRRGFFMTALRIAPV